MSPEEVQLYKQFISPQCDRAAFIQKFLNQYGLDCPVLSLAEKKHLYVKFPINQYNPMFKIKTVIAHYDRVEGSPGANDNSSSVFGMLLWAVRLSKLPFHNVRIIFTDGEELGEDGINSQGAFALAQTYKKLGITNDEIYVFDCVGRGLIPIICNSKLPKNVHRGFLSKMNNLENKAEKLVSQASGGKWFKLDCNYSDNASFIVNGIPAVCITFLPGNEVDAYVKNGIVPYTWEMFHTEADNFENLTLPSFDLFAKILDLLAIQKTLLDL